MVTIAASDTSYSQMKYKLNDYELYSNIYNFNGKIVALMNTYSMVGAMSVRSKENNIFRVVYNAPSKFDYLEKTEIRNTIRRLTEDHSNIGTAGWFYEKVGDSFYLFRGFSLFFCL